MIQVWKEKLVSKITKGDNTGDDVIKSQENGAKSNSTQETADSPTVAAAAEGGEGSSSGFSSEEEEEDSEGEVEEGEGLVDLEDLGMIFKILNF